MKRKGEGEGGEERGKREGDKEGRGGRKVTEGESIKRRWVRKNESTKV